MRFAHWLYIELRYNAILSFLLGGAIVWALEQVLQEALSQYTWWGPASLVASMVVGILLLQALVQLLFRLVPRNPPAPGVPPSGRRGLILLLGRAETALFALSHHTELEQVWLIVTNQSNDEMERMLHQIPGRVVTSRVWLHDAYSQDECRNAVERSVSHARNQKFEERELICDLTGGTVAMTIGAFQACQELGISAQMVSAKYDRERKRPIPHAVIALDTDSSSHILPDTAPAI